MKFFTFKMRIMLFTGIIVLFTAGVLTLTSMYNMKTQMGRFSASIKMADDILESEQMPSSVSYTVGDADVPAQSYNTETYSVEWNDGENIVISLHDMEERTKHNYNIVNFAAMILVAAVSMTVAYFVMGKSLKPIRELSNTASSITEKDLNVRLPKRKANDEISSLTDSFNSMLDRLSAAFEQQKQFSANAAHELKTPLACIKTGLQTLCLDTEPSAEDYREVFEIINRNAEQLTEIVNDLLTLTNDDSELPKENVSLNAMLVEIVRDLIPQYENKEVEIKYEFPQKECFILCTETLTYRLFYNLIENALKYNKQGGKLTIGISELTNNRYVVRIQDTGIGIPSNLLPRIWESFYCVDPSRSKKLGGVGLGLSMVKEIAERFAWNISVNSVEGIGTQFVVEM